jgi:uncharacterized repeat protein (TIGR02059 family)
LRHILIILILVPGVVIDAQSILTVRGQIFSSTYAALHDIPTNFTFKNNSISTNNSTGYQLLAGDEIETATNNNLDRAVISGNKFTWTGVTGSSITHGIFTGYNINDVIKYNYTDKTPYGVIVKSGNADGTSMSYTSGGIAYNIIKDPNIGVVVKGIKNVNIYNNTFYSSLGYGSDVGTLSMIYIQENDGAANNVSTGCRVFNNIFYTKNQVMNIWLRPNCISGFESDYNIFYCEAGTPLFVYGTAIKTFSEWQALGYDTHSIVINPNFTNLSDFVPSDRLNYGTDLGATWLAGLSATATWTLNFSPSTTNQNGLWQVGARIYDASPASIYYVRSSVENETPSVIEVTYSLSPSTSAPPVSAFEVKVNSVTTTVNSVSVSGTKILLTLANPVVNGDEITVAYTIPGTNPLQSGSGEQAANLSAQEVTNNVGPGSSPVYVSSVVQNDAPDIIEITYNAALINKIPSVSAFQVNVNSEVMPVSSVVISGTKLLLILTANVAFGDIVTVAYTKPVVNPVQTPSGGQAASITAQTVINNCNNSSNQPPIVTISSPGNGSLFNAPATIVISVNATDPDGSISKIEFFNRGIKLGERNSVPYSYTWTNVPEGSFLFTAIATDNLNSKSVSSPLSVTVSNLPSSTNRPPVLSILKPAFGNKFISPATVNIAVDAQDPDGSISKVEYFLGTTKLGENLTAPYSFSLENAIPGTYQITVVATDNLNATNSALLVYYITLNNENSDLITLYPNPNNGQFSIDLLTTLISDINVISVTDMSGNTIYSQVLPAVDNNSIQFDFSYLTPGVYILVITGNDTIIATKTFIKE